MCQHSEYIIEFAPPEAYEDTNIRRIKLRAHCRACGESLRFIGVDEGLSLTRPCASSDGFTILIPGVMGVEDVVSEYRMAS